MSKPLVMLLALLSLCLILVSCSDGDKPEEIQPPTAKEIEKTVSAMDELKNTLTESEFESAMDEVVSTVMASESTKDDTASVDDWHLFDPNDHDNYTPPEESNYDPLDGYEDGDWLESPSFPNQG